VSEAAAPHLFGATIIRAAVVSRELPVRTMLALQPFVPVVTSECQSSSHRYPHSLARFFVTSFNNSSLFSFPWCARFRRVTLGSFRVSDRASHPFLSVDVICLQRYNLFDRPPFPLFLLCRTSSLLSMATSCNINGIVGVRNGRAFTYAPGKQFWKHDGFIFHLWWWSVRTP